MLVVEFECGMHFFPMTNECNLVKRLQCNAQFRHAFFSNQINRMPRFLKQPTSKPIGNKIEVHTRERETITGTIVDFVVEVRDKRDYCVQMKENDVSHLST